MHCLPFPIKDLQSLLAVDRQGHQPRPLPRRPESFLSRSAALPPPPDPFPSPEILFEPLELPLDLGTEPFKLLLVYGSASSPDCVYKGSTGFSLASWDACLLPQFHLLRVQAPLPAVGAQPGGIQPSGIQNHRELAGCTPALRILLRVRHHVALQPPCLPPVVEVAHVNAQLG